MGAVWQVLFSGVNFREQVKNKSLWVPCRKEAKKCGPRMTVRTWLDFLSLTSSPQVLVLPIIPFLCNDRSNETLATTKMITMKVTLRYTWKWSLGNSLPWSQAEMEKQSQETESTVATLKGSGPLGWGRWLLTITLQRPLSYPRGRGKKHVVSFKMHFLGTDHL